YFPDCLQILKILSVFSNFAVFVRCLAVWLTQDNIIMHVISTLFIQKMIACLSLWREQIFTKLTKLLLAFWE
ncbi:MAG: hypothetical protein II083_04575, partial [Ruminococcus sp.]|nr:hypothetical protein [Ruminococcus sp.]